MTKTYNFNRVTYRFSPRNRAWLFEHSNPNYTLIRKVPGAAETAHRVARLVDGSFVRHGKLEGSTRANIDRLIEAAASSVKA